MALTVGADHVIRAGMLPRGRAAWLDMSPGNTVANRASVEAGPQTKNGQLILPGAPKKKGSALICSSKKTQFDFLAKNSKA